MPVGESSMWSQVQSERLLELVVGRIETTVERQMANLDVHVWRTKALLLFCLCRFKMLELCNAAWGISKMSLPLEKIDKGMQARSGAAA